MAVEGGSFESKSCCVSVNATRHSLCTQRVVEEEAANPLSVKGLSVSLEESREPSVLPGIGIEADSNRLAGFRVLKAVAEVHGKERGNMEFLGEAMFTRGADDIGMTLVPGGVLDLGDHALDMALMVEGVIKAQGIEEPAKGSKVGQEGHSGTRGPVSTIAERGENGFFERVDFWGEKILSAKAQRC